MKLHQGSVKVRNFVALLRLLGWHQVRVEASHATWQAPDGAQLGFPCAHANDVVGRHEVLQLRRWMRGAPTSRWVRGR